MKTAKLKELNLKMAGQMTTLAFAVDTSVATSASSTGTMVPGHGTGLDGMTKVDSLGVGTHPKHPGRIFLEDTDGNAIGTNPDEMLAALRIAAPDHEFTVTKKS